MKRVLPVFVPLALASIGVSAQTGTADHPAAPVPAGIQRTYMVTASVPEVATAVVPKANAEPTNETQRLEIERAALARQLGALRQQAIARSRSIIQQNATLSARQKRIDDLSAELDKQRMDQQRELETIETASGTSMQAEYARIVARLKAIDTSLAAPASTAKSAHP